MKEKHYFCSNETIKKLLQPMKKVIFLMLAVCFVCGQLQAQDIIVKKDGTILNVYHLEESSNSYFYSLDPSSDANVIKINKEDVFSIKKQDGTTITVGTATSAPQAQAAPAREPVTAQLSSEITTKKGRRIFSARTPDGNSLDYAILSEEEHTLTVIKGEYHEDRYIIPEKVQVNDEVFTVTEIDKQAFFQEYTVKNVQFPTTLKRIGEQAFTRSGLESIILPEGLEELEDFAFFFTGWYVAFLTKSNRISEIYIPSSCKKIGTNCFIKCGNETSFRGFCQAYFSNLPEWITEGNCKSFGIDEEAVRAFNLRKR